MCEYVDKSYSNQSNPEDEFPKNPIVSVLNIPFDLLSTLSESDKQEYIRKLFENNPDIKREWLSLNHERMQSFKLSDGNLSFTYYEIATIFGFTKTDKDPRTKKTLLQLSKKIFGDNDPDVVKLTNKQEHIRKFFENNPDIKKKWASLNDENIGNLRKFKLNDGDHSFTYYQIASIFGFTITKTGKNSRTKKTLPKLSKKIFGDDDPDIIKLINPQEYIRKLFKQNPDIKREWLSLNYETMGSFKLNDGDHFFTYSQIATIFGFSLTKTGKDPRTRETLLEISKKIFSDNDPDVVKLTNKQEYVRKLFENNPDIKKKWLSLNYETMGSFKLNDGDHFFTYSQIATIFGFSLTKTGKDSRTRETLLEISKKIFGDNDPDVRELAKKLSKQ